MSGKNLDKVFQHIRATSRSTNELGSRFEKLMKLYLQNDSVYKNQFEKIWLWSEYPDKKSRDLGVDIVAEKHNGERVAIQCKFYSDNTPLIKKNIDSFLNELGKKEFSEGIIIFTGSEIGTNVSKSLNDRNKLCVLISLSEIENSDIPDWWSLYKENKINRPDPKKLRPHQKKALEDVMEGFKKHKRGKLIMPCGTGKTFTAFKIAERISSDKGMILVLLPSLGLVSQTYREFMQNARKKIHPFIVCSDKKAGKDVEDISFSSLPLCPTTDSKKLSQDIKSIESKSKGVRIIFSTYHSIDVISKAQKTGKLSPFDLIICDEAHRTTGVESPNLNAKKGKESYWLKVHKDEVISTKKRLYMTATPRIYTDAAKKKADSKAYNVFSMDEVEDFGPVFHELKFSEAISQNLLSDYKVIIFGVDKKVIAQNMQEAFSENGEIQLDEVGKIVGCWKALSKEFLKNQTNQESDIQLQGEGYKDIKNKKPMQRAVAFSSTIAQSKILRDYFQKVVKGTNVDSKQSLRCEVHHVDGGMNAIERGRELSWLKGEIQKIDSNECRILTNAKCLSEGIDVPSLDAVMFLKPKKSEIDIVQSVGRVMRRPADPKQKKEFGYVILPVVVDSSIDPSKALDDNESFSIIWKVLQALRSHDDRLEAEIDKMPYSRKLPNNVTSVFDKNSEDLQKQLTFSFMRDWKKAMIAKLVLKCGDREYIDKLGQDVTEAFNNLLIRMKEALKGKKSSHRSGIESFLKSLRATLNPSISEEQGLEMLAMHSVTKPLFQSLFDIQGEGFPSKNPVSKSMDDVLKIFKNQINAETKNLGKGYKSIKKRVNDIDSLEGRQNLIKEVYQHIFKKAFPKMQEQLGIVYTPVEIVDFILQSSHEILKKNFSKPEGLSSEGVKILDPFSGTGTFLTRLIEVEDLIQDKHLNRKYGEEIFSIELVLLAYYISVINVESSYHFRKNQISKNKKNHGFNPKYEEFPGAVFADTFQLTERAGNMAEIIPFNKKERNKVKQEKIQVIVGNPPYSGGQKSANDNNKNLEYDYLDGKIRETYRKDSKHKKMKVDSYVRALKWAKEKLDETSGGGVISFVTNGGFVDNLSCDGLRHHLAKDFTDIYIFNLRGDLMHHRGEGARKEGGQIFGEDCSLNIAIVFLVNTLQKKKCEIHYYAVNDYMKREEKLKQLKDLKNIFNLNEWKKITPNKLHDWINQRDLNYEKFPSIGSKENPSIFDVYTYGVATNRDAWTYSFSSKSLEKNMKKTINFYNREFKRYKEELEKHSGELKKCKNNFFNINKFVTNNSKEISWSRGLKKELKKKTALSFDSKATRASAYRPFTKMNLYYCKKWNEEHSQIQKTFPTENTKNLAVCVSGRGARSFSALMVDYIPDLQILQNSQHFSRYKFELKGDDNFKKSDNINKDFLLKYQDHYEDSKITRDDIFYYIYGLFHSKDFVGKYQNNLIKDLPRIPMVNDFYQFSKIGKKLSDLHLKYEKEPKHKGVTVSKPSEHIIKNLYSVEKMKHPRKGKESDKSTIIYNNHITISDIPLRAYDYMLNGKSAITWIMERYQIKENKKSGLIQDPNLSNQETYILDLLLSVITVSMKTLDLVDEIPKITDWGIDVSLEELEQTRKGAKEAEKEAKKKSRSTKKLTKVG